jgi:glycosyltransferase involved in cell wall biosynthesis
VGGIGGAYDVYHVIDHSYGQLVHRLPAARTVVTCHDLDTFRSLLRPEDERRSPAFKAMMRRVLSGVQRAARVLAVTTAIRDELIAHRLVPADRIVVVPNGVGAPFVDRPDPEADARAAGLVGSRPGAVEILHVGSTIPRKRIDLLLTICGELRRDIPELHLVRVGGPFTVEQQRLVRDAGLDDRISVLEFLDDRTLAAVYRRAAVVVQPSDREGFGLPLIEAMACGTPVVASDLPVLREVGGPAVEYCPPGASARWTECLLALLRERRERPELWMARRQAGVARAARFSWPQSAARVADVYGEVAASAEPKGKRQKAEGQRKVAI